MEQEGISFNASLYKIQTEPSGGWRIILDVPQTDADSMIELSKLRNALLSIGIVPSKKD